MFIELLFKTEGSVHSDIPERFQKTLKYDLVQDCLSLEFRFFSGEKPLYFHVSDPEGRVRIQILSKHKIKSCVIYNNENIAGPGICPGTISRGTWLITAYAFGARCTGGAGNTEFSVEIYRGNYPPPEEKYEDWIDRNMFRNNIIVLGKFEKKGADNCSENNSCKMPDSGIKGKYENSGGRSWLRGDFHAHTTLSDGSSSPAELLNEGFFKNLDFFYISEHGILSTSFPEKAGITVYPSYEITTCSGHLNLHGLRYIPENILSLGPSPEWRLLENILAEAKKNRVLVSINHPMLYPWQWLYNDLPLSMIDAVEVITDPYAFEDGAPEANEKAVALLDVLWNTGYRIAGIGGSDTHSEYSASRLGQPVTQVYAEPGSMQSILSAVKNCRAAVYTDLDCTFEYRITGKEILPGTELESYENTDLEIFFDPGKDPEIYVLRIIENGFSVKEIETLPFKKTSAVFKWAGSSDWVRCEIRDNKNMIRAFINPVYRKKRLAKGAGSKSLQKKNELSVCRKPDPKGRLSSFEKIKTWGDAAALLE